MNQDESALCRDFGRCPPCHKLTRQTEAALWYEWKRDGSKRACDQLIRANLHHVVRLAFKYRRYGLPLTDLVGEGNFGIVCALHKFDPEQGCRFMTYAAYWIRAHILRYVLRSWSIVGTDSGALRSKMFFRLRRERARVYALLGEGEAAHELLAHRLNLSPDRVQEYEQRLFCRDASLEQDVFQDNGPRLIDTLACPTSSQEDQYVVREEHALISRILESAIAQLDRRERFVLRASLMCDDDETLSLAEIGRRLGVSRERTRQLSGRALKKIRRQLLSSLGPAELESLAVFPWWVFQICENRSSPLG